MVKALPTKRARAATQQCQQQLLAWGFNEGKLIKIQLLVLIFIILSDIWVEPVASLAVQVQKQQQLWFFY